MTDTITLPRPVLEQALEALKIGYESAKDCAETFHIEMAGYKQQRHEALDAEVKQISDAIGVLRTALSAAASDEDGDTIKVLRAAIEQARDWIAEHPDRRPVSAGRMVATLTNALAAAPQPPVVEQGSGVLNQCDGCMQGAPLRGIFHTDESGKSFMTCQKRKYTHPQNLNCKSTQARLATLWGYVKPQPKREPLPDEWIRMIYDECDAETGNEFIFAFARAIERAVWEKSNG